MDGEKLHVWSLGKSGFLDLGKNLNENMKLEEWDFQIS